jgi:hypothetical protein
MLTLGLGKAAAAHLQETKSKVARDKFKMEFMGILGDFGF